MEYIYLLSAIPFIATSIIFYLKFQHWNVLFNAKEKDYIEVSDKYTNLTEKVKNLNSEHLREGYYEESIHFTEEKGSKTVDSYKCICYVYETDKYTNGESKCILDRIEVISGYHPHNYEMAKNTIRRKFLTVRPTIEIEWLEREEDLKILRKKKLEKILEEII